MPAAPSRRPTILIVDDSPGVLQNLSYLLSPHLNVVLADSGPHALAALTPETSLVLTDVRMPGMSGLELTRQLRRRAPGLPVAFMTGIVEADLRAEAEALDVLDVLRKPLRPGVLFPALQGWLGQQVPALGSPAPARTPPAPGAQSDRAAPAERPAAPLPDAAGADSPRHHPPGQVPQQAQMFVAGLRVLPGVTAACAFDLQGVALTPTGALGAQVGAYVRFLLTAAQTLAPHLGSQAPLKAAQLEFQDRVLVVCPFPGGVAAVLVRDTPGASGVKAWMRGRLT
ncbi:response regulator [Deinococcus kurensis]|uniref:response regulator n=1 Tax=Deinococcus kurensis TaxID=2662757 RepID=UPI0012D2C597|nr:response regulator [Deinococcus kurensis]